VTKPVRLAATEQVRGSNSNRGRRPAVAFAGAVALLAAGGAAATFLIGGDQTRAAATDAPQIALAAAVQQLPVRTVKTISIKVAPKPNTTKTGPRPTVPQKPASAAVDASDAEALPPEDPRWARQSPEARIGANSLADLETPAGAIVARALAAQEEPSDPMVTAAIFRNEERALELAPPASPELAVPAPEMPVTEEKPAAEERPAPQRTVRVNDGVNLRARPASGSKVLRVVPARASVGLVDCKAWCEVIYDGTRGFIYKSFVGGKRAASRKKPTEEKATANAAEQALPGVSIGNATENAAPAATNATAAAPKAQPKPSPWLNKHENR
jgi:hypothetical protein